MTDLLRVETWAEPDGRTTWVVRRYVDMGDFLGRYAEKWFNTRAAAEAYVESVAPKDER